MKILRISAGVIVGALFVVIVAAYIWKLVGLDCAGRVNLLADSGLLTGLASFVLGFVAFIFTGVIEGERTRRERKEMIEAVEKEIEKDFFHALEQIMELEKESRRWWNRWESEQRQRVSRLRQRCESETGFRVFLQKIGKAMETNEPGIDKIIEIAKSFCRGDQKNKIIAVDNFRKGYLQVPALEILLSLWDEYDVYSADLVVNLLSSNKQLIEPDEETKNKVKEALEKTLHRKRLIRYQQLDWMRKSYGLTLPGEYQYISPFQVSCMPDTMQVTVPYADFFNRERFINESWVGPIQWEDLISTDGFACFFAYESDAEILLRKLWRELTKRQNRPRDGIFPVYWDVTTQSQAPISLEQIAHRVAGTWFEFLSFNPNAFLDLHSAERDALVGYLGWHVGSLPALLGRLRQRFLLVGDSIQQEKDVFEKEKGILLEKVANSNLPYNKGDSPREEQLFDWLGIRPPWLTNTVIIVVCQKSLLSEWQKVVNAYQKDLLKQKVVTKGLVLTTEVPVSPAVLVSWSDDALMNMLRLRAQRVSGGDSFSSLFSQFPPIAPPLDYDRRLVRKSNGSLGRMLELGQQIILHHAVYHENEPDLLEDDFKVIENT